jgi:Cellulose biosynthesis protein BcsS
MFLSLFAGFVANFSPPALAEPAARPLSREVWSGVDISSNVWLVYSGATVAPFGQIHDNGLRLRATVGYGEYAYISNVHFDKKFDATTAFADVLVGYLYRYNALTAKAFAGVSFIDHNITPFDAENISINSAWGAKGVLEFWYNSSPKAWSSLDLAYTTAHHTASVRMRSGYRIWPQISIGAEGGLNIDGQAQCKIRLPTQSGCKLSENDTTAKSLLDFGRTGLFARYEWTGGEVSLSAGGMGQILQQDGKLNFDPYVTANWIMQF